MRIKFDIYVFMVLVFCCYLLICWYVDSYSHFYTGKSRKPHNTEQYKQITVVTFGHQNTGKHEIKKD